MINLIEKFFDYTLGYVFKAIFAVLKVFVSDKFDLIIDEYGNYFWSGIKMTMTLALLGTIFGLILALIFGNIIAAKENKNDSLFVKILKCSSKIFTKIYVTIFRGTPMIIQATIFYYTFHQIGIRWSPFQAGLFTVSVNTGAYLTEVIRGGIQSIDKGQEEAARSLGFNHYQTMLYIILPQAIKNSFPSIGNEFIVNIKDTAVLSTIMIVDIFKVANSAVSKHFSYFEPMLLAAMLYLFLTYTTSKILRFIEKKMEVQPKEITSSN